MSFASDLRQELYKKRPGAEHCKIAELAGILSSAGRVRRNRDEKVLRIKVEQGELEDKIEWLFYSLFHTKIQFVKEEMNNSRAIIEDELLLQLLYQKCKFTELDERLKPSGLITEAQCCRRSFLRGVYEARGSITSPEKAYQLEIACSAKEKADQIIRLLEKEELSAKMVEHRSRFVVYLKDAEKISYFLGIIGASRAMMELENVRIVKDIRNSVNREVNCDAANMKKTSDAAVKVSEDIKYIFRLKGEEYLPENLREIAELRLEYPELSLKELGEKMTPPLGKSGVNHRLRKISDIAEKLKG